MTRDPASDPKHPQSPRSPGGKDGHGRAGGDKAETSDQGRMSGKGERSSALGSDDSSGGMPDFIRRLAAVGLSGFFTTESALRKALGDTLPKDWVDFAAEQSERTRHELLDRLAGEFGKVLEHVDLNELMDQLLTGRTVEVTAQIRLAPDKGAPKRVSSAPEVEDAAEES